MRLYPIILCGGPGSRLWPASTARRPKPFIDLLGGHSLFQRTVIRMAALPYPRSPVIVTGLDHIGEVSRQLDAIRTEGVIIAEPVGRDSAPALLAAALWIGLKDPDALAVAVASDHHIPDNDAFAASVTTAIPAALAGEIVTFGVQPDLAATHYGYIRAAEPLPSATFVHRVGEFVEKPNLARAKTLVEQGCFWNSGNFMFSVAAMIAEAETYAPALVEVVRRAVASSEAVGRMVRLGPAFVDAAKVSIDVALMEKTDRAAVLPITHAWSDLGAWDAIWSASPRDEHGNSVTGVSIVESSRDCLVRASQGAHVIAIGLDRVAVIVQDRNVLVTALDHAPLMKPAVAALDRKAARPGRLAPGEGPDLREAIASGPRLMAWLWRHALPTWWCFGADHTGGGYHEQLDQELGPLLLARRARVQARQTWVYATAGSMGWPGPWPAALDHGLDFLMSRYRRDDGLFRGLVGPTGQVLDDRAVLYDQAFVLLALAAVAKARQERRGEMAEQAMDLARVIRAVFGWKPAGFRAGEKDAIFLGDPIMHLFEAVLAWFELTGHDVWRAWAEDLSDLFLGRMYNSTTGTIPEVFDETWGVHDSPSGSLLAPGHHFEWAWLAERWGRLSGDPRARPAAEALFASGEAGVEAESGLVVDLVFSDLSVCRRSSRLWPQTERLKAALILASLAGAESRYLVSVKSAAETIEGYLDTPMPGLWRDTAEHTGPEAQAPAPASSFYHIVGAIAALDEANRSLTGPVRMAGAAAGLASHGRRA